MKLHYFILLMFKRYLKSPAFVTVLLLVPLCCCGLRFLGFGEDLKISAGIYNESKADLSPLLSYEGAVKFTVFDTLEEMEASVTSKKTECGYFLTENLPEVYDKSALKGSVICYKSPSTAFDKVINEIIFSELFKSYAYDIAADLAAERGYADLAALKAAYDRFLNQDAVISLSYEYIEDTPSEETSATPFSFLKGIFGIFIMIGGLLGAFYALKDDECGILKTMPPYKKAALFYSYFLTSALLCAASAVLGFALSGAFSPKAELINTILYSFVCAAFAGFIYAVFPSYAVLSAISAFLPLGCLIFCPIFVDVSSLIRPAALIQKLLIPTFYIQNKPFLPLIITFLLSYLCLFLRFCRSKQ